MTRVSIGWRPGGFSVSSEASRSPYAVIVSVRGMGVADITSTSAADPFSERARR